MSRLLGKNPELHLLLKIHTQSGMRLYPRRQNVPTSMVGLKKMVTYAEISPKEMKPRDTAGNAEKEEELRLSISSWRLWCDDDYSSSVITTTTTTATTATSTTTTTTCSEIGYPSTSSWWMFPSSERIITHIVSVNIHTGACRHAHTKQIVVNIRVHMCIVMGILACAYMHMCECVHAHTLTHMYVLAHAHQHWTECMPLRGHSVSPSPLKQVGWLVG